jgi:predicted O-methyltransferase YrrM
MAKLYPLGVQKALAETARRLLSLRVLPPWIAIFYWRAHRRALRTGDQFSLASAARPSELAGLLSLARQRRAVVELGTGTAWSAIALALADDARRVISYDPSVRPQRDGYLVLVRAGVRARIELRDRPDSDGPQPGDPPVELLFIDSSHDRDSVLAAFGAWRDALASGAIVAFHDYDHPEYPGVRQAVAELQLSGRESGGLFVWRAPSTRR